MIRAEEEYLVLSPYDCHILVKYAIFFSIVLFSLGVIVGWKFL